MDRFKIWLQAKFINLLVKRLFNTITERDVLKRNEGGQWVIGSHVLNPEEVTVMRADALRFKDSLIWKALSDGVRYAANQKMYEKSTGVSDILAGKSALWTLAIIEAMMQDLLRDNDMS